MGVKVAVVGGGSTYTPELVEGFVTRGDRLRVDELVLLDIDPERLAVVGALAERMVRKAGWPGSVRLTQSRDEAIEGADFVIVQLRVGGQAARYTDETIPLEFGCIGQETTGPGGYAKALRTVPVVLELARETARHGAPGAWFVDFTNPTGLVTQALLDEGHRALGLCNVAIGFQRRFAEQFGVGPEHVRLDHVGLNHLTWERAVYVDGADRLPELLEGSADLIAEETDMPVELVRALAAIPSSYLHYYYLTSEVLAHQRSSRTRAEEVMEIEADLIEMYKDPTLDTKPKLLEERGGAFYSDAAAALVASLHAGTGDVQVVNVRNAGAIPNLPADDVVEISATVDRDGAHPISTAPLAADMLGLVQHAKAYERLAIEAATTGDRSVALKALMTNPLVGDYRVAAPLLDALLDANRAYLPQFA
ncbi:MAG TPA: 6-phospho-beta-glucosidase [Actinomycetota bacterium]|jgi:6-phospho-beta-glucosidase|nr:6-phospho-beta-glucosidase [Actinomycetota bacterium]